MKNNRRKSTSNAAVNIAVIGGGPKAAALAAKAFCLNEIKKTQINITIFESKSIGASWNGENGYTNGSQALCTPAERDLGFPYNSTAGQDVEVMMQSLFSWNSFKVASGDYPDWVGRGRTPPTHLDFAKYINKCVEITDARVVIGEVVRLSRSGKKWKIRTKEKNWDPNLLEFDAAVVTGHGPQASRFQKTSNRRVFDGRDVWMRTDELLKIASQDPGGAIVLIGAGGTSAAIAGWLVRKGVTNPIIIIGNQASLFARVDNWFENRVFTDKQLWASLSDDARRKFTERLTRGAVWANVLTYISNAKNITYRAGQVESVTDKDESEVNVNYITSRDGEKHPAPAIAAVDATGFDDMWFTKILPDSLSVSLSDRALIQEQLDSSLAIHKPGFGPIHLPMLSQIQSPAFVSLMALGEMSTEILSPYLAD